MMYHLFENEIRSISGFNSVALTLFSFGSFFANCIIAVVIGWGFSSGPMTDFGLFMSHKGVYYLVVLMLMCFAFGGWAIYQKRSVVRQIKAECRTDGKAG